MRFEEFERRASEEWERIPNEYRQGVDGLVIERHAQPHPTLPDVYTLGECVTESYPSEFGGPDTTRSAVVLYYGSFFRLSRLDDAFDWEHELWETLTHELQHHLESLANEDSLIDVDYAADESFKRAEGEPFDPFFFRRGVPEHDAYRVEDEYFIELTAPVTAGVVQFMWAGVEYAVDVPALDADVTFVHVTGGVVDAPARLQLVLIRAATWRAAVRSWFARNEPRVSELERHAARAAHSAKDTDKNI